MPIKERAPDGQGNLRAGNDRDASTRPTHRKFRFRDVESGELIPQDQIVKAPGGTKAIEITPVIHSTIVDMVSQGNFLGIAVKAAGISRETFIRWAEKASVINQRHCTKKELKELKPYVDLMTGVAMAVAQAEVDRVKIIDDAANSGKWGAAAWWLERKFPQRWGKQQLIEHTGEIHHKLEITRKILADPDATAKAIDVFESVTVVESENGSGSES